MKRIIALLPCIMLLLQANQSWAQFDKHFHNKTLRMDYAHCGDSQHDEIYFEELLEEPYWGGSKTNLIDTMFYGNYYLNVYDVASNQLIYSRGYCTLFGEWQTTDEAQTTQRYCSETVVMPFPKNDVRIEISARNKKGKFVKKFEYTVDVDNYFIKKDRRMQYPTYDVHYTGNPSRRVDIVLLPEGYTADEMDKFKADCKLFAEGLFSLSPYKENQGLFNIRAVLAPSQESGVDIPGEYIWKNTILTTIKVYGIYPLTPPTTSSTLLPTRKNMVVEPFITITASAFPVTSMRPRFMFTSSDTYSSALETNTWKSVAVTTICTRPTWNPGRPILPH